MKYIIILLKLIGINMNNSNIKDNDTRLIKLNYSVNFTILSILSSIPIYFTYLSIQKRNNELLSTIIIMLIPFINYIVLLNYFRKSYFFKIYTDIIYNSEYTKYKLDKFIFQISISLTSITMIISYIFISINYKTVLTINNIENKSIQILYIIYSVIYNFYSRFIFFFNTIIFFVVFYKHYIDLYNQVKNIKLIKSWSNDKYKTSISVISYNLLFIRNEINKSIKLLEYIYISSTVLGSIVIGIIIENKILNIFLVGSLIIWGIIQIGFLFIMTLITTEKEKLIDFINKPKFCCHYLIKTTGSSELISCIDNDRRRDYFTQFISKSIEEEEDINIVIPDENVIKIRTNGSSEGSGFNIENESKSSSSYMNNMRFIQKSGLENSSSIDWIILNKILLDNWATFKFMGIEFTNSDGIKKIIGMVGLLIYAVNVILHDFNLNLN